MGHELAGAVVEVGESVTNVKPADRVVIETVIGDGVCDYCRTQRYNICEYLYDVRTKYVSRAYAEFIGGPAEKFYKLPDHVSFEEASLIDTFSVYLHAQHLSGLGINDKVAVIGPGPIGLGQLMLAKASGADVIICDVVDSALELARELGADAVVNNSREDPVERVMQFAEGRGADIVFECAGGESMPQTLPQVTKNGPARRQGRDRGRIRQRRSRDPARMAAHPDERDPAHPQRQLRDARHLPRAGDGARADRQGPHRREEADHPSLQPRPDQRGVRHRASEAGHRSRVRGDLDRMSAWGHDGEGDRPLRLWVGSYAGKGGGGLYPLDRAPSGAWSAGEPFEAARDASFGARSARHDLHYLVDEQGGTVGIYRHDESWVQLATVATGGAEPCYVALDPHEAHLAVANYGSGSVALYALDRETGLPSGPPDMRTNSGRGPDPWRQEGPHAHCALFSREPPRLYQVDLGTDEILAWAPGNGLGEREIAFAAPPSSGPRHLVLHPTGPFALLISELASTLTLLERTGAAFRGTQVISTLPPGFAGESLGGHLPINEAGDRLYVTNRGHDSIATFAFDGEWLSLLQHVSSRGASPRFVLLLEGEKLLVVANEEGGNVTGFELRDDGTLAPAGLDLAVPGAVFLFEARHERDGHP